MGVVFGAPIPCGRVPAPSDAEVDAALEAYMAAVRGLFDRYKREFGCAALIAIRIPVCTRALANAYPHARAGAGTRRRRSS